MMRWWVDRGVDGFRMDVINLISKDPDAARRPGRRPGRRFGAGAAVGRRTARACTSSSPR